MACCTGINILPKNVNSIKTLKEERILFLLMASLFVRVQNIDFVFPEILFWLQFPLIILKPILQTFLKILNDQAWP